MKTLVGMDFKKAMPHLETGEKRGPFQMDVSQEAESSDSSGEDLDTKEGIQVKGNLPKKLTPVKASPALSDWSERDRHHLPV